MFTFISGDRDRRPESRGFALDSHNEEDSFSGDGLEREKRWLDHFRERRGPRSNSRSVPKDSSSSSKDSSRYSFSTEFSSGNNKPNGPSTCQIIISSSI